MPFELARFWRKAAETQPYPHCLASKLNGYMVMIIIITYKVNTISKFFYTFFNERLYKYWRT